MPRFAFALGLSLILWMCGGRSPRDDAGPPPEEDAGPAETDAGGGVDAGDGMLDPADVETFATATRAFGVAAALGGPLIAETQMLRDEAGTMDDASRRTRAQTRIETAVSGNSVVEPATCAAFSWTRLSATITFTGCTLEATGEPIDGSLTLAVSFFPTEVTLTFTALTIGTISLDGSLTLNVGGECQSGDLGCTPCPDGDTTCIEMRQAQISLSGDLTIDDGGTTLVAVDGLSLVADAAGVTVNGTLTVGTTEVVGADLYWALGDCMPTSGTATLTDSSTTLTFLPTTPATGNVAVMIGMIPLGEQMLFTPCP